MDPNDAHGALADVQRNQERTREEYVRHQFARPYMLLTALGLFTVLASSDLPSPWNTAGLVLGECLLLGVIIQQRRRAAVRRKMTAREMLFVAGGCIALLIAYSAFNIAAGFGVMSFGLPAPRVFAAAAIALLFLAVMGPARRIYGSMVRNG